jgi:hypothetical protein
VPLWKNKGSRRECDSYRGISLLSQVGKIYAKSIENRIRPIIEPQLSNNQFGFRKNKSCTDAIFTLRQLSEKAIEYNINLNAIFIDQEKAFDRVNRNKLWRVLEEYGVKGQILENIMALYKNSQSAVKTTTGLSDWFKISSGVRQGCVLSPLLFITYMDRITKSANENNNSDIHELLFADDQCIVYESEYDLQEHVTALNNSCTDYDMKLNTTKTETLKINKIKEPPLKIYVEGKEIKQTSEYKYLGSVFTQDGKFDREIEVRI